MATQCEGCQNWFIITYVVYGGDYWERQKEQRRCFKCLSEYQQEQIMKAKRSM